MRALRLSSRLFLLKLTLLFAAAPGALATTADLVRDLRGGPLDGPTVSGSPVEFHVLRSEVLFMNFEELWVSDGTPHGTRSLTDATRILAANNQQAFFLKSSRESSFRELLWRTDGRRSGTYELTLDLRFESFDPPAFLLHQGLFYVTGLTSADERGVWVSDGTTAGTRQIYSGAAFTFTALGDRVYFIAEDSQGQLSLWRTDGSAAGTVALETLSLFSDRQATSLTSAGGRLFWIARDDDGDELWTSNGSPGNGRPLTDARSVFLSGFDKRLHPLGDHVYFGAEDGQGEELWRSDGTVAGTQRLTNLPPNSGGPFPDPADENPLLALGDRILFITSAGQLWSTAGNPASTTRVLDQQQGDFVEVDSRLYRLGGVAVVTSLRQFDGRPLVLTDGTPAGTRPLDTLCGRPCARRMTRIRQLGEELVFENQPSGQNAEVWTTDGTATGTRRLARFASGLFMEDANWVVRLGSRYVLGAMDEQQGTGAWAVGGGGGAEETLLGALTTQSISSNPQELVEWNGQVVFTARVDNRSTDILVLPDPPQPVPADLVLVPGDPGIPTIEPTPLGDLLLFATDFELWRTDAQGNLLKLWEEEFPGPALAWKPERRAVLNGVLYFVLCRFGCEVWRTDGTPQGTREAFELAGDSPVVHHLATFEGALYLIAEDAFGAVSLWKSSGSQAGTVRLREENSRVVPPRWIAHQGEIYLLFAAPFGSHAPLWKTDGTPAGTVPLSEPLLIPEDLIDFTLPQPLAAYEGEIFFVASTQGSPAALWKSDGTTGGTGIVREIGTFSTRRDPPAPQPTVAGGLLFFVADDGIHGSELWRSDGTAAGTVMVRDIHPGARGSAPLYLVAAGEDLYFRADDGVHGAELWRSDGTAEGTGLVQDLHPGVASSEPRSLFALSDHLLFSANDGLVGFELWSLPLAESGCRPNAERLCLSDGRFQVEARWTDFQGNNGTGQAVPLTADTGYFWFFEDTNVEAVLKVLDGGGINNHHWTFYGALSNVEYFLTVTDTETGAARRYFNPSGNFASVGDTRSFGPLGAGLRTALPLTEGLAAGVQPDLRVSRQATTTPCQPSATRLCLSDGRFAVEARWATQGTTGVGRAVPLTEDTGYFWFFQDTNVEAVLKVLDGRALNGFFWVFYGALSNVDYDLIVTDTQTGTVRTYLNRGGAFASVGDTRAF